MSLLFIAGLIAGIPLAQAAKKPNILLLVSDDTGYGDLGAYGGGVGRGMPKAGEKPPHDFMINGQYANEPDTKSKLYPNGVVGLPFFDGYVEKAAMEFLETVAKSDNPFFTNVNFMKVHQPNMPAPEFKHKSISKTGYADSLVELDTRIGRIMDKLRSLGLDKNTLVFYTTDAGFFTVRWAVC